MLKLTSQSNKNQLNAQLKLLATTLICYSCEQLLATLGVANFLRLNGVAKTNDRLLFEYMMRRENSSSRIQLENMHIYPYTLTLNSKPKYLRK